MKLRQLLTIFSMDLMVVSSTLTGCALIDEKTADCPEDMALVCALNLVNNKEEEMDARLGSLHDRPVRAALEDYLTDVFVTSAHDVDLFFYDQRKRGKMTVEEQLVMDADQREFAIKIPASDYRMGSTANLSAQPDLFLVNTDDGYKISLVQKEGERVASHPTAIFTARRRMLVRDNESQRYDVTFQMTNAAAAIVLNRDSCEVKSIRADYGGLADSFKVIDSTYSFGHRTLIEPDRIDIVPFMGLAEDSNYESEPWVYDVFWTRWEKVPIMFCGVGFPSPNVGDEIIGIYPKIWTIYLYVTLPDDTVTRSEIYIGKPLQAGHLMIIKGWICGDGSFTAIPEHVPYFPQPDPDQPADSTVVGVSVQLNWKMGSEFNPDL